MYILLQYVQSYYFFENLTYSTLTLLNLNAFSFVNLKVFIYSLIGNVPP